MTPAVPSDVARRLGHVLARLDSPHDGEIVAAAKAAGRMLANLGLTFRDLVQPALPPPDPTVGEDWRATVEFCLRHPRGLTFRELEFVRDLQHFPCPSPKQRKWLAHIATKVHRRTGL